jgi:predicted DNA-binding protein (UPF0251 family)
MARPHCCRTISHIPHCALFKPAGVAAAYLEEISLSLDEFEAVRLADFEGLYHEQAAERMNVSRQTFGRTLELARRKIAQALVEGKALRIHGGAVDTTRVRKFKCTECRRQWGATPEHNDRPRCPGCRSRNALQAVAKSGEEKRNLEVVSRRGRGSRQTSTE